MVMMGMGMVSKSGMVMVSKWRMVMVSKSEMVMAPPYLLSNGDKKFA